MLKAAARRIIKYLILSLLAIGALHITISFINFNQYKQVLEEVCDKRFDLKVQINGDIKYKLLPLPHIEITKVLASTKEDKMLTKFSKADIYTNLFSMPSSVASNTPSKIYINNGEFNYNAIMDSINTSKLSEKLNLVTFVTTNSSIIRVRDDETPSKIKIVEKLNLKFSKGGWFSTNISLDSKFSYNHKNLNFTAQFDKINEEGSTNQALVKLFDKSGEITFSGELKTLFTIPQLNGKIKAKINDIEKFGQHFPNLPYIKTFLKKENFNLEGDIKASREYLLVKNVKVNSTNIKDLTVQSKISFYPAIEADIDMVVDNVNFDKINFLEDNNTNTVQFTKLQEVVYLLLRNFSGDFLNDIDLLFNFKVNSLTINGEEVSNLAFNLDSARGDLSLNKLEFKFPGEGRVALSGVVTKNLIRPKFIGDFELSCGNFPNLLKWLNIEDENSKLYSFKNLIIKSKAELIPNEFKLIDVKAALDNLLFVGYFGGRNSEVDKVNLLAELRFNKIDGDYFTLDQILNDLITKLYISDYDKTGEVYSKITNDYKWLRRFGGNISFNIEVDEFILNKYLYKNFNFSADLSPNNISINKLAAQSEYADFNGRMNFSLPSFKPLINVNFNFDTLNTKFLDYILPSQSSLQQALMQHLSQKGKEDKGTSLDINEENAIVTGFNFYSANNHDGNIDLKIGNYINNDFNANDIELVGSISNGLIVIDRLNAKAFDGQASIRGNVAVLSPVPSVSISFALYNVNPGLVVKSLAGLNNMSGYLSASGSLSGSGINSYSLISNMQGGIELLAKKVKIQGFDIGQMIEISELTTPLNDKLKRLDYYEKYGESLFDTVKGKISIQNGIATFEDFTLENNRIGGAFAAKYDIYNHEINSIARFSFIPLNTQAPIDMQYNSKGHLTNLTTTRDVSKLLEYINIRAKIMGDMSNAADEYNNLDKESILRKRLR